MMMMMIAIMTTCVLVCRVAYGAVWPDRNCGRRELDSTRRIVGGRPAKEREFPWIVSIQSIRKNHFCGGSIISTNVILTAAHCLENVRPRWIRVQAGFIHLKNPGPHKQVRFATEFILHEDYVPHGIHFNNDVALIRLSRPFNLKESRGYIGTICLPESSSIATNIVIAGWGHLSYHGQSAESLMTAEVFIQSSELCAEYDETYRHSIMFCAHRPGTDACLGDSGGPVSQNKENLTFQVGIVSFGKGCAERPGYYVRLSSFTSWIEDHMIMLGFTVKST
ncbi:serine protease hepsin-like [Ixodes scapularis]|uniref:serine protease hepsin-like n=1 Tax=Ixodes scapularis TaxID=6945 RepID=UPI001A9F9417|nr:serine protease hepsin-like [Ixodes scapularis]